LEFHGGAVEREVVDIIDALMNAGIAGGVVDGLTKTGIRYPVNENQYENEVPDSRRDRISDS
jgi:hypothetical protein